MSLLLTSLILVAALMIASSITQTDHVLTQSESANIEKQQVSFDVISKIIHADLLQAENISSINNKSSSETSTRTVKTNESIFSLISTHAITTSMQVEHQRVQIDYIVRQVPKSHRDTKKRTILVRRQTPILTEQLIHDQRYQSLAVIEPLAFDISSFNITPGPAKANKKIKAYRLNLHFQKQGEDSNVSYSKTLLLP